MKIVHLIASIDRSSAGVGEVLRLLTQYQSKDKINQIEILSLKHNHTDEDIKQWTKIIPSVYNLKYPKLFKFTKFGYSKDLKTKLGICDYDLLHNHGLWMYPSYLCRKIHEINKIPYVISPHGMLDPWAIARSRAKKNLLSLLFERKNLNNASCLHALSDSEYQAIRAYGIKTPVCIIPNGVDLPSEEGRGGESAVWNGSFSGRKVLLFIGRLHPKKGLSVLIGAYAKLKAMKSQFTNKWAIAICGWDQLGHRDELERMVKKNKLHNDIKFFGPVYGEVKNNCLSEADAFVLPSFSEGLPISVLEAWSYKLPVVMTSECNLPEGFDHYAAVKITTDIPGCMSGLIQLAELSDSSLHECGSYGFNLVKKRYTWGKISSEFDVVYKWIIGGGVIPSNVLVD